MARQVSQIQSAIIASLVSAALAVGITIDPTQWSQFDYRQLLTFVHAVATATLEQLWDVFTADIEAVIAVASPQTAPWIQNQVLNVFQYDATTPQIPRLDNADGSYSLDYATPDNSKKIITQCVVVPGIFGTTSVKAAKSTGILAGGELSALQSFLNILSIPGLNRNASSGNADKIYINGIVTFQGAYSAVIQATVVAAIQGFLASIPTSGVVTGVSSPAGLMKLTDLIAAVRAVPGVTDFELQHVNARPDATAFVPGTYNIVQSYDWLNTLWQSGLSGAGYMVGENTPTYTLNDSITYNAI